MPTYSCLPELPTQCAAAAPCRYWSPISFTALNLPFGDGGGVDNLAVTPLLRRRMTKIVVLVAALKGTMDVANASDWAGTQACLGTSAAVTVMGFLSK